MEKSSQKLIRNNSPANNPFTNLLSQVNIRLPKPNSSTKNPLNFVLHIDPNIDRHSNQSDPAIEGINQVLYRESEKPLNDKLIVKVPLKTKNSSNTKDKSEKQTIMEWIIAYMRRRKLLGPHWEFILNNRQYNLIVGFYAIKQVNQRVIKLEHILQKDHEVQKLKRLCLMRKKILLKLGFQQVRQFAMNQTLFGLSQSLEQKDRTLFIKLQSQNQVFSSRLIQPIKYQQKIINPSLNNVNKSQGLSELIMNYNKLNLPSQQLPQHQQAQQIKDSKYKEGCLLQLESRKGLGGAGSRQTKERQILPLQSRRGLNKETIGKNEQNRIQYYQNEVEKSIMNIQDSKDGGEAIPLTLTYMIKNIHEISLDQPEKPQIQPYHNYIFQNKFPLSNYYPHINNKPILKESSYPINLPQRNVFLHNYHQLNQLQKIKRPISLQTRPLKIFDQNIQKKEVIVKLNTFNKDYYPEENCVHNFVKETLSPCYNQKPRTKSATPKITFTFTNQQPKSPKRISSNLKFSYYESSTQPSIDNQKKYEQNDFVIESFLRNVDPNINESAKRQFQNNNSIKLLQFSSKKEQHSSPKKLSGKLLQNRKHIVDKILPEINPTFKFTDNPYHISANNNHYGRLDQIRAKSPKDKILVTSAVSNPRGIQVICLKPKKI